MDQIFISVTQSPGARPLDVAGRTGTGSGLEDAPCRRLPAVAAAPTATTESAPPFLAGREEPVERVLPPAVSFRQLCRSCVRARFAGRAAPRRIKSLAAASMLLRAPAAVAAVDLWWCLGAACGTLRRPWLVCAVPSVVAVPLSPLLLVPLRLPPRGLGSARVPPTPPPLSSFRACLPVPLFFPSRTPLLPAFCCALLFPFPPAPPLPLLPPVLMPPLPPMAALSFPLSWRLLPIGILLLSAPSVAALFSPPSPPVPSSPSSPSPSWTLVPLPSPRPLTPLPLPPPPHSSKLPVLSGFLPQKPVLPPPSSRAEDASGVVGAGVGGGNGTGMWVCTWENISLRSPTNWRKESWNRSLVNRGRSV